MIQPVKTYLLDLQNRICQFIEIEDGGARFHEDVWTHPMGGGGATRVISGGHVIEKGGVNFSHVCGITLPQAATLRRPELLGSTCQALGVSVVMHPLNPYAPTCHMNVRCIVAEKMGGETVWWFGGGFDLTPYYGFEEDCRHFHQMARQACLPFGEDVYPKFKTWADDYFYLKHRNEARGIGGIFFDDLSEWGFDTCFAFMRSVGDHFIKAYQPILNKRKTHHYQESERHFQLYRRGRYVEFNLLYDRGTMFGLQSNGRTESILMSLPPLVAWQYDVTPIPGSREAELYEKYLPPKDWVFDA